MEYLSALKLYCFSIFIYRQLLFSILFILTVCYSYGQSKKTLNEFLAKDIDTNQVFKNILPNGKSFLYTKSEAIKDFSKNEQFPFAPWENEKLVNYTISNIFSESDTILIDSVYISRLIKQYREFNNASNKYGESQYFRPDYQLSKLGLRLADAAAAFKKQDSLISPITKELYGFYDSLKSWDKGFLRPIERLDTLMPKLKPIQIMIKKNELTSKYQLNNTVLAEKLGHLSGLIETFQQKYGTGEKKKVTEKIIGEVHDIWEYAGDNSYLFSHEKRVIENHIEILKDKTFTFDDQKFSLLRLLSIDQNVNYDPAFISDRQISLENWLKETKVNRLLSLEPLRLTYEGKFQIRLVGTRDNYKNSNAVMKSFLKMYKYKLPADESELKDEFTSKLLFTAGSLFYLPRQQVELIIYGFGEETEFIEYDGNTIKSVIPPCSSCMAETYVVIHKDEYKPKISISSPSSINSIEKKIYKALEKYFQDKSLKKDSWKRMKVENGAVIVWLFNARKLVLENENYWENVKYEFTIKNQSGDLAISLNTFGEFGTGIAWGKPPSYAGYKSMEPKFTKQLQIYCSDILYIIKDFLTN
ncbi:MAG: hypothetical protein ABIY60_01895 [Flavobacterium circumlabens]